VGVGIEPVQVAERRHRRVGVPVAAGWPVENRHLSSSDNEPEELSGALMDQCSRHDIPPAVWALLTEQRGHDLRVELDARQKPSAHLAAGLGHSLSGNPLKTVEPH
jgi:hypothetical protein